MGVLIMGNDNFVIYPIGVAKADQGKFSVEIKESFRPALKELNRFGQVIVTWWADQHDNKESRSRLETELPYAQGVTAGVFACRSEYRPNPIAITTCKITHLDEVKGIVELEYIDAADGTPVLDLKPYIPVCDRMRDIRVAEWYADWPDWYEDAAAYFSSSDVEA